MDMDQPIDIYFTKIDDSMQYAADGKTPYTEQQIMISAENAVRKTGMYKETLEDEDNTQQGSGYHQANAMPGVTTALEHLAMAATADKRTMEELASTNWELSEAKKEFSEQLKTLTNSVKKLTQKMELSTKRKLT
eukprot:7543914-Ditylum_brightwellii.AAC.1